VLLVVNVEALQLVPTTPDGWRSLFWFGAAPPVLIIAFRWYLPETNAFLVMKAEREARHLAEKEAGGDQHVKVSGAKAWLREVVVALKGNWVLCAFHPRQSRPGGLP
jgi:MFS transporter, SHS family, lactate transporter